MIIENGKTAEERVSFLKENRTEIIEMVKDVLFIQNQNELKQAMEIVLDVVTNQFYDYTTMEGLNIESMLERIAEDFSPSAPTSQMVIDANNGADWMAEQQKELMRVSL